MQQEPAGRADAESGLWPAPAADGPVRMLLRLPGSKSMTNRALLIAALADAPTVITSPLRARDTLLMAGALRALGATIEDTAGSAAGAVDGGAGGGGATGGWAARDGGAAPDAGTEAAAAAAAESWLVTPGPMDHGAQVEVGNAGTVMRFVPPVAPLAAGDVAFRGDPRASQRPVQPLIAALRALGADIDDGGRGAIPFTVHGTGGLPGGAVTLDASGSSQLVSGLLLAGCRYDKGLEVRHQGPPVPSAPHIAMTVSMLRAAGAEVDTGAGPRPEVWRVYQGALRPGQVAVEPDLVNSAPFLAAALITGGTVTVAGWPRATSQPAGHILDLLTQMGAACERVPGGLAVTGTGVINGIDADLRDSNELAPVLTAVAALAGSPSVFTGIGHMRTHETDRLAALATEINALGGDVRQLPDGLEIRPRPLTASGVFDSYDDHRMVMTAAVLGLAVPGIRVRNAGTVAKTFPAFTATWAQLLGGQLPGQQLPGQRLPGGQPGDGTERRP